MFHSNAAQAAGAGAFRVAAGVAACLAVLSPFINALAADGDAQTVVITGTREPTPLSQIAADVVVIDAGTIHASTADSIEDLLRREAGLQLSRSGGPGQSAGVFIRGAAAGNTLVLVDGVRVGSATLGIASLEAIGLAQVERIEVLRGPGSSLYGADAVGGVVQIFTRRGAADGAAGGARWSAHAAAGGERSFEADLGVSGVASADIDYAAGASHAASRGVSALREGDAFGNFNPDHDGYRRSGGQLALGYTPAQGHRIGLQAVASRLNAQFDASEFAPPDFAQDASPDFRNRQRTDQVSLSYRGAITPQFTTSAQAARQSDRLQSGGNLIDRFDTVREQATWQNAWKPVEGQQILLALDAMREKAQSTAFVADVQRRNTAVVLGYAGHFGDHALQIDVRHDDNADFGGVNTGRIGWTMDLTRSLRLRALAGSTFRAPSFNDLYFPGYGVPGVRPERGRSLELGLTWASTGARAGVTVYRNRVRDLIGYQPDATQCPDDPDYAFGCASNVSRAQLQGATIDGSLQRGPWRLQAGIDFLEARDRDSGVRLPRRAAHQENLRVEYDAGSWSLGGALLAVGARPDGGTTLSAYQAVDLFARWRVAPQWRIEASVLNVGDRDVQPARDYQQPGRQAWIGVRYGD
jgi:vitamin B12 transporter